MPGRPKLLNVAGFAILGAVTLLGFAAPFLPPQLLRSLGPWFAHAEASPWAPAAAILGYTLLASFGVPQIVLVTLIVAAFGPWAGLAYSWTGKLIACGVGFAAGRAFGARLIARRASPGLANVMRELARRGFIASALIRLVPTAPSVLVNVAAGVTPMRFTHFIAGTALGSLPKMALLAFGGQAAMTAMHDNSLWAWLVVAAAVALWAALALAGRRWLKARGA
jgi:uncharacterized membrane protein YdjX (TVP38/TMEM64 family)